MTQCIIVMTSNLGAAEMTTLITGGFGFARVATAMDERFDDKVNRTPSKLPAASFLPIHEPHRQDGCLQDAAPDDMKHYSGYRTRH